VRARQIVFLVVTLAGSAWAALLTFGGGVAVPTPWGRLSSRDPVRPLGLAILAGVALAFSARGHARSTRQLDEYRWPPRIALLIAVSVLAGGIRLGTFTAGGSDPSGYVSESVLWRTGQLTRRAPEWVGTAPWPDAERTAAPLGYMPGPVHGTQVPTYPAGLPLLMAVAHLVAGPDAEYYVVPIAGAILVWASYLLGARLSTPWGGVLTSGLTASSPPFLMWLVMPMGDLPAAACWTLALVTALSSSTAGAVGAGLTSALAILIRPNLFPLTALIAAVIWLADSRQSGRRLPAFCAAAATGPLVVAAVNWSVYGSPLQSGYGNLEALYSVAFVWPNIQRYSTWFLSAQTAVPLVGFIAPFCPKQRLTTRVVAVIVIALPAFVLAFYLPYTRFEDWSYLRFLLPAYPALFAGAAVVAWNVSARWAARRWVAPALALVAGLLVVRNLDYSNAATDLSQSERRYQLAASALAQAPVRTVFISSQHSGSLRHYTGRDVLRWDLMDATSIDTALQYLTGRGYRLYWVGDPAEREIATTRFPGTRFLMRLDSAPLQTVANVQVIDLGSASGG
jgi:hypothetical protein